MLRLRTDRIDVHLFRAQNNRSIAYVWIWMKNHGNTFRLMPESFSTRIVNTFKFFRVTLRDGIKMFGINHREIVRFYLSPMRPCRFRTRRIILCIRIERRQTERQHNKKFAFFIFLSHEAILLHKETDFSSKKEFQQEKIVQTQRFLLNSNGILFFGKWNPAKTLLLRYKRTIILP